MQIAAIPLSTDDPGPRAARCAAIRAYHLGLGPSQRRNRRASRRRSISSFFFSTGTFGSANQRSYARSCLASRLDSRTLIITQQTTKTTASGTTSWK